MGEMSSIVSRRPSLRKQSNDALWMSIRFGSSRTSLIREKDVRARGAATLAVKRYSLPYYSEESEISDRRKRAERQREPARVPNAGVVPQGKPPRRPRTRLNGSAERNKGKVRACDGSRTSEGRVAAALERPVPDEASPSRWSSWPRWPPARPASGRCRPRSARRRRASDV